MKLCSLFVLVSWALLSHYFFAFHPSLLDRVCLQCVLFISVFCSSLSSYLVAWYWELKVILNIFLVFLLSKYARACHLVCRLLLFLQLPSSSHLLSHLLSSFITLIFHVPSHTNSHPPLSATYRSLYVSFRSLWGNTVPPLPLPKLYTKYLQLLTFNGCSVRMRTY